MTDSRDLNYSNKENPKDSKYLPTVRLNALKPTAPVVQELPKHNTVTAQSVGVRKNRALIFLSVIASVAILLFLVNRLTSSKSDETPTSPDRPEMPSEAQDAVIDSLSIQTSNPILAEEAINNGCIIITGTFSQLSNAQTMLSSIESSGYNTYQSSDQPLIRVGLHFDCVDVDLDSMLLSVRENLSNKAWYLVPRYEPDL